MKKSIFVLTLFAGIMTAISSLQSREPRFSRLNFGSEWKSGDDSWAFTDGYWVYKKDPKVSVAVKSFDDKDQYGSVSEKKIKTLIKEYTNQKLNIFANLSGITEWKVQNHSYRETPYGKVLELNGTYFDSASVPTAFNEVYVYGRENVHILSLIYPKGSAFTKSKQPQAVISRFLASAAEGAK